MVGTREDRWRASLTELQLPAILRNARLGCRGLVVPWSLAEPLDVGIALLVVNVATWS